MVLSLTGMGNLAPAPGDLAKSSLRDGSKGPTLLSQGSSSVCFWGAYPFVALLMRVGKEGESGSAAPAALQPWLGCNEGLSLCKELTEMLFQGNNDPLNPM